MLLLACTVGLAMLIHMLEATPGREMSICKVVKGRAVAAPHFDHSKPQARQD